MAARLGDALYWAGCIVAVLILAFLGYVVVFEGAPLYGGQLVFVIFAGIVWLIGRACRYVLRGPTK